MKRRILGVAAVGIVASLTLVGCSLGTPSADSATSSPSATAAATPATPRITSLSATTGSLVGGETVTLSGTSLTGVTGVKFNGTASPSVTVVDATTVKAVVPSAVNYQPSRGAVVAYKGSAAVESGVTYTWSARTGVDREMQYAFAHWDAPHYNPAYLNFDSVGGDCQNFVSQSLLAGGLPKSSSWFYDSASDHSSSWGYAPSFDELAPSLGFTSLTSAEESKVQVGDLAYFDWNDNGEPDHVMIVSAVSTSATGAERISLVGHNLDYDYRDLQTTITKDHPGADVWFYALPASLRQ
jgi:hypothetical protein